MHAKNATEKTAERRWFEIADRWVASGWLPSFDTVALKAALDRIVSRYDEQHRHYHTLEHVLRLLRVLDHFESPNGAERNSPVIRTAIWYHDAVYDVRSTINERDSADLALRELSRLEIPAVRIEEVRSQILATDYAGRDVVEPEYYLIRDTDLSILGVDERSYDRYSLSVRREYIHLSDEDFVKGRKSVLQSFLQRNRIFHTPWFFERFEASARTNILREFQSLKMSAV